MPADDKIYLSKVRIENAEECLNAARSLYKSAVIEVPLIVPIMQFFIQ